MMCVMMSQFEANVDAKLEIGAHKFTELVSYISLLAPVQKYKGKLYMPNPSWLITKI